jgi:hypothetical protein
MKFGEVFQPNCRLRVNFGHVRWDADCGPYELNPYVTYDLIYIYIYI